jgi:hypothetical protein
MTFLNPAQYQNQKRGPEGRNCVRHCRRGRLTQKAERAVLDGGFEEMPAEPAFPRVNLHHLGTVWAFLLGSRARPTHALSAPSADGLPDLDVCMAFWTAIGGQLIGRRLKVEICLALWAARGLRGNLALTMATCLCIPGDE